MLGNSSRSRRVTSGDDRSRHPTGSRARSAGFGGWAARCAASLAASAATAPSAHGRGRRCRPRSARCPARRGWLLHADLLFEVADLPAQRRLGRVQLLLGGNGQAAGIGDGDEVAEMPELHRCCFPYLVSMAPAYKVFFKPASALYSRARSARACLAGSAHRAAQTRPCRGRPKQLVIRTSYRNAPARRTGYDMSKSTKPGIVFAHGLWADGSCFSKLIPALRAEGHEVIAAQYGLDAPQPTSLP